MTEKFDAFVFDASGFSGTPGDQPVLLFLQPHCASSTQYCVIVLGRPPMQTANGEQTAAAAPSKLYPFCR